MNRLDTTSTRVSMWFAFFAGPIAWAMHEAVTYALVKLACGNGLVFVEYVVTVACLAVVAAGGYISYKASPRRLPRTSAEFMYTAALVLNGLFAYAILMEALPNAVLSPCL